jgi:hypothetical protein
MRRLLQNQEIMAAQLQDLLNHKKEVRLLRSSSFTEDVLNYFSQPIGNAFPKFYLASGMFEHVTYSSWDEKRFAWTTKIFDDHNYLDICRSKSYAHLHNYLRLFEELLYGYTFEETFKYFRDYIRNKR